MESTRMWWMLGADQRLVELDAQASGWKYRQVTDRRYDPLSGLVEIEYEAYDQDKNLVHGCVTYHTSDDPRWVVAGSTSLGRCATCGEDGPQVSPYQLARLEGDAWRSGPRTEPMCRACADEWLGH